MFLLYLDNHRKCVFPYFDSQIVKFIPIQFHGFSYIPWFCLKNAPTSAALSSSYPLKFIPPSPKIPNQIKQNQTQTPTQTNSIANKTNALPISHPFAPRYRSCLTSLQINVRTENLHVTLTALHMFANNFKMFLKMLVEKQTVARSCSFVGLLLFPVV